MNFYFIPTHNQHSVNLNLYSYYGKIDLHFSIYKNDDKEPSVFWPFPKHGQEDFDDSLFMFEA